MHWLMPSFGVPTSHFGKPIQLLTQLPAVTPGKATKGGPRTPAIHVERDPGGIHSPWLWPGPALAVVVTWRVKQQMEDIFLSISLCFVHTAFQISKS